jgi:PiT family inorganic phosphate transporter
MLDFGFLSVEAIIVLAGAFGLYMAWTIGANDVANAMGTSVGSGALSLKKAIIVAGILEFAGAVLAGGSVTGTVRKGILDAETTFVRYNTTMDAGNGTMNGTMAGGTGGFGIEFAPELYIYGMLAALLGTAIWLTIATYWGMPVSTTHSIVGGVIGAGLFAAGSFYGWRDAGMGVAWDKVGDIVASWLFAPLLGGIIAFAIFWLIKLVIFNAEKPIEAVQKWRPLFIFVDVLIIAMATLLKGLKNVDWYKSIGLSEGEQWLYSFVIAGAVTLLAEILIRRRQGSLEATPGKETYKVVERQFVALQIVTAGSVAFAHGANDVANAIGPLAGIVSVAQEGAFVAKATLAWWILPLGGIGIVLGLATWGHKVMKTIGKKLSEITPSRGFAAELAAAATIILATIREIPVSTSQILVGSVLGVGLARGVAAIDLKVLRDIVFSWILTLPAAALISGLLYLFFKTVL